MLNSLNKKKTILKEAALKEAVEWCQANDYKEWKAVKSRLFPQIKDLGTINKHLGDEFWQAIISGLHSRRRMLMYEESDFDSDYDVSDDSTIGGYSVDYQDDYQDNEVGEQIDLPKLEWGSQIRDVGYRYLWGREVARKTSGKERRSSEGAVPRKVIWSYMATKVGSDHKVIFYF